MQHLELAFQAWEAAAPLRHARSRFKNYTYGRQWLDPMKTPEGKTVSEGEYAELNGARPLTNNMIRQLVKCITGNFRASLKEEQNGEKSQTEIRNCIDELDCRMLEEFLISGCAIQRVVTEHRIAGTGVWVDNVSPARFFANRFTDPRGSDIELIGMLHDYSLRETIMRFAADNPEKARRITETYSTDTAAGFTPPLLETQFHTAAPGRCRVIELWTLESRNLAKIHDTASGAMFMIPADEIQSAQKINARRQQQGIGTLTINPRITARWHCRMFAPSGLLLDEFDSPYAHGLHPFAVKFYPLTDGEVHSFVEDIVDQQRYVNRLITLIDHIMSISAKGALLFPTDSKPDTLTWQQLSRLWSQPGAVIPVRSNAAAQMPQQIVSPAEPSGAYHLLDLELQLLQQVSGVNNALQGRLESRATSAALFEQQVQSSSVAILDILESFNEFRRRRNLLIASTYSR